MYFPHYNGEIIAHVTGRVNIVGPVISTLAGRPYIEKCPELACGCT